MTMTPLRIALTTLSLIAAVSCSSNSALPPGLALPTLPSPEPPATSPSPLTVPFLGTWNGTVNLITNGTASLQLTLGASGDQLRGTWAMMFSDGRPATGGTVTGGVSVDGSSMSVEMISSGGECPTVVSGTINGTGTQIAGKFDSSAVCGAGLGRPVTLFKQ